jgi:hypothetical protein
VRVKLEATPLSSSATPLRRGRDDEGEDSEDDALVRCAYWRPCATAVK